MGKALKTAGMIIGGAVLVATGVGALVGINVAAMGIASFTGSMTIGQLGLLSSGMSAVGGMLEKPKSAGAAAPTDWTANPDQPTPFAFGRVGVAGKIVHRDEYGKDNKLQGIVSVYSGAGPIKSYVSFSAGDLPVTFESNGGTAVGKYNRQMWRSWRLGAQPDTALSLPTGLDDGAVMPGWGAAYKLSGKACDLWTLQQDSKLSVYPGNVEPKPLTVLEGIYGYDHRYDSTYPGGFGDCRLNDRSTWRWIDNGIIAGLNWALGMKENGKVVGGVGASIEGIDLAAFAECANVADANNWKVSAWPDTSEDVSVVLDQLLQAGGASRSRNAGRISCVTRGAPRSSIVTITRNDTAGAVELDTGATLFNRLNTITPRFMSEAAGWKLVPADPVTFETLRTEDGGRRGDKIDYRFVPALKQAAELAAYDILDAREPFSGTIPLKPHLRRLKPGDCFDIDEPGFLLDGVKFVVLSRGYDPSKGEVRIAFRSETDSKHALALGKTTTMPDYPTLTPADPTVVTVPAPGEWAVEVPIVPPGTPSQPTIIVTGEVDNGTVEAVIFEIGPTAEGPWSVVYEGPPTTERFPITGLDAGATYYVAVSYRRGNNYSDRTVYGPQVTQDLVSSTFLNAGDLAYLDTVGAAQLDDNAVDLAGSKVTGKSLANIDSAADTKLAGIAPEATKNTGALADLNQVNTPQIVPLAVNDPSWTVIVGPVGMTGSFTDIATVSTVTEGEVIEITASAFMSASNSAVFSVEAEFTLNGTKIWPPGTGNRAIKLSPQVGPGTFQISEVVTLPTIMIAPPAGTYTVALRLKSSASITPGVWDLLLSVKRQKDVR